MSEQQAVRQLVKSPPELWAQCSDAERLGRHLNCFGEIRITRLEPESTVAWEGEAVSGTVTLEASGWGTRVRLTALGEVTGTGAQAGADEAPAQVSAPPLVLLPKGLAARLSALLGRRGAPAPAPPAAAPTAVAHPEPAPATASAPESTALVAELEAALDSLGQAHHRPYSRS